MQRLGVCRMLSVVVLGLVALTGCEAIQPPLDSYSGVTLQEIADLQNNTNLNDFQRAAALRGPLGLEDNPDDNQVLIFLLNLQLPARGEPIPLPPTN